MPSRYKFWEYVILVGIIFLMKINNLLYILERVNGNSMGGHSVDVPNFQAVVHQHWHAEHMGADMAKDINSHVWVQRIHTMTIQV